MATFTWKKATSLDPSIVLREEQGCIVLASYVTGSSVVLLSIPLGCLKDMAVASFPTGSVNLEDRETVFTDETFDLGDS